MKSAKFAVERVYNKGFTLVELSIVLVILGLLVGGVLSGQSLIRAAELRSITAQQQRFVTSINAFRDKYFALPGDMTNAQSFWGVANATPSTCYSTAGTGTQTCNGMVTEKSALMQPHPTKYFAFGNILPMQECLKDLTMASPMVLLPTQRPLLTRQ